MAQLRRPPQSCESSPPPMESQRCADDFYERLLSYLPGDLQADFKHVCATWREACNADWAWLWLYNSNSDTFELSACSTREQSAEGEQELLPDKRYALGRSSIAAFCCRANRAVHVEQIDEWRANHDGTEYRVTMAPFLAVVGCVAFDCVPLVMPDKGDSPSRLRTEGVISLHWRAGSTRLAHDSAELLTMGRLSALSIHHAQMTQQRTILVKLNRMAQRFATAPNRRPAEVREEYLRNLIRLIQRHINVGQVSIFYRLPFANAVQCIATTGLSDSSGAPLPDDRLKRAVYRAFEGLTGCCFGSAELISVNQPRNDRRHLGRFVESRSVRAPDGADDPIALFPIPTSSAGDASEKRAVGVIRCTGHYSPLYPSQFCHFNTTELETLGFIAEQVGPVLQTFAQRISRERSISVVKHDLAVPMVMIRDVIHGVIQAAQNNVAFGEHDLEDIQSCNFLAINLVRQLDPDPGRLDRLDKQPTYLEGHIVARLCSMLRRYARLANDIDIHFDGFRDIPMLTIDRDQIERALFNLLLNAVKYGRSGSTVEIRGRRTDVGFWVDIVDFGMGVDPEEEPHIFEPGFRSARAAQRAQGLGLGLAITRQIMRAHGGDVTLTSPRDPTCFSLFLPADTQVRS